MPPELPTFPTILAEAGRFSINDLAIMSPGEMSPEAEQAYIAELRAYRERYEKALGVKKEGRECLGVSRCLRPATGMRKKGCGGCGGVWIP